CPDEIRVRLLLIDAPERSQRPFGGAAAMQLELLLPRGSRVSLELDVRAVDQYGRTLAYVFSEDGRMINEEMVRSGYALVLVYPPNVRYVERIRAAAAEARAERRGLWHTTGFECTPREHRRRLC
ncbi:MAG: thermonuclease family protein, partial [Gemmatimonadota bacterium]